MAAGRKIRDEAEAQQYLLAARRSGVSIVDWAGSRGVDGRSLRAWVINLGRRTGAARARSRRPARSALVELVPVRPRGGVTGTARYVVDVGAGRVEFDDGASMTTLRRVIEALRSC
jgi:hypothetical protein